MEMFLVALLISQQRWPRSEAIEMFLVPVDEQTREGACKEARNVNGPDCPAGGVSQRRSLWI